MTSPPKWYVPVTIIALVWNLLGCLAYLGDVMMKPEDVAQLPAAQQELYAARTAWAVAATAIAVWCGAAGSLGLILRKRWAKPLLLASLAGLLVQDFGLLVMTDAARLAGPVVLVLQGCVLLIAIGLVALARTAASRGWIPKLSSLIIPLLVLGWSLLSVTESFAQEKKDVTVKVDLPKPVQTALMARFPGAVIVKQTKEEEDKKEIYDIEFTQGGQKLEADFFADGTIHNWEKAITMKDLPPAVTAAMAKLYPKVAAKEIMAVTTVKVGKEALEGYEVLFGGADKKEFEVTFAPDGKILEDGKDEE